MLALRVLAILLTVCVAWPTAAADPVSTPPELTGSYDEATQTIHLNWTETAGAVYHVYRDNKLIASTTQIVFNDTVQGKLHVYTVTADDGEESPPSNPYMFITMSMPGEECEPIVIIVDDDPPGVDPGFHPECLPGLPNEKPVEILLHDD